MLIGTEHGEGSQPLTPGNVKPHRLGPGPRCPRKAAPRPPRVVPTALLSVVRSKEQEHSHSLGEADPLPRGDRMGTHGCCPVMFSRGQGMRLRKLRGSRGPSNTPQWSSLSWGVFVDTQKEQTFRNWEASVSAHQGWHMAPEPLTPHTGLRPRVPGRPVGPPAMNLETWSLRCSVHTRSEHTHTHAPEGVGP